MPIINHKKLLIRTLTVGSASSYKEEPDSSCDSIDPISDRDSMTMEGGSSCPSSPNVKRACRLVVLGSTQTGKSCVINRFLKNTFDDSYVPTIENFHRKLFRIHGEFYQLDILEVGGNDPFPAVRRLSLITGDLFLLIFSVDNRTSYEEVIRIRDQVMSLKEDTCSESPSNSKRLPKRRIPIVIAANKSDLPISKRNVDLEEVRLQLMGWENIAFSECSAKTNDNVDELFFKLFHLAKLPKQMSPGLHRQAATERSLDSTIHRKQSPVIRLRSKHSEPAMAFDADAKRPSLRTDLLLLKVKNSQQHHQLPLQQLNKQTFILPTEKLRSSKCRRNHKKCTIM